MDKLKIIGKEKIKGSLNIFGAKNASLPLMVSCLLSENGLYLSNLPDLNDINTMKQLLINFGVKINYRNNKFFFDSSLINNKVANYDLVRKMRASILILGPLLARFKKAKISLPGGCAIGTRPIDIHIDGLKQLGVDFSIENGFVTGVVTKELTGSVINLPFPSVGATENIIMASTLAKGVTVINNAAREPEIKDLSDCLNKMGAKIIGAGSKKIIIRGVQILKSAEHKVLSDRIVAGTYCIAAIMLNNKFRINNIDPILIKNPLDILTKMGANIKRGKNYIKIYPAKKIKGTKITTKPYPGFPTDLQAQMMALMSIANGKSQITETIFENRFMHVSELNRLGSDIKIKNDIAIINGNRQFKGTQVMASDLRASVSLVLAGLCAEGETIINRVYHLDRGYENIEKTLGKCGLKIYRFK